MGGDELDLRLRLGSCCGGAGDDVDGRISGQREHQITIFYNGRICVGNVTESQARAIIATAEQEMDDRVANGKEKKLQLRRQQEENRSDQVPGSASPPPRRPPPMEQLLNNQQNSMKRSLQLFLQKRKSRSDAVAPYDARRPLLLEIN